MKKFFSFVALASAFISFTACVSSPRNIKAEYVDPTNFSDLSCEQLDKKQSQLASRLSQLSDAQRATRQDEETAMWAGIIFFGADMGGGGPDFKPQIAPLKGELQAVQSVVTSKGCTFEIMNIDDVTAKDWDGDEHRDEDVTTDEIS